MSTANTLMASSYLDGDNVNMQVRLDTQPDEPRPELPFSLASPRHLTPSRRPLQLGDVGTPTRNRKHQFELPGTNLTPPKTPDNNVIERKLKEIMKLSGTLTINGIKYKTDMYDLVEMGELGHGTSGHVVKMLHKPSQELIAVKQMRRSGNLEENKRIAMDLEVVLKSHDCPYIVQCLGCFITDSDVWICMELMSTCFEKLLKRLPTPIPEPVIGKVALSTVRALDYLKETHGVIHRDVKPSNILLDYRGNVKLCDFGISGHLVNSKANTKNAGCTAYLAPERIAPPNPMKPDYDIRADVWSLGITLVELATGSFPYPDCKSDFEVLSRVLQDDPPRLPANSSFTLEFREFVSFCLAKDFRERPKYKQLLANEFLQKYVTEEVDVAAWYNANSNFTSPRPNRYASAMNGNGKEERRGHQRSLSEVRTESTPFHHRFSPFKGLMNSPLLCRRRPPPPADEGESSNSTATLHASPLLLQRFYHQQSQHHRSTSLSPNRVGTFVNGVKETGSTKKKLSSYLRWPLGGNKDRDKGVPPEPPPRQSRASPFLIRKLPGNEEVLVEPGLVSVGPGLGVEQGSPSLSRRYVSPSPPQPPPRRLSDLRKPAAASPLPPRRDLPPPPPPPG